MAEIDDTDVIVKRKLDGRPLTTYAQFVAELAEGRPDAGVVHAQVNLTTLIGGFVRFRGTEAQNKACEIFRNLHEQSQVGGARAVDPRVEPVDGGGPNPEAVFERGVDARRRWQELTDHLGRVDTRRLAFVVIGEWGPTSYARFRYGVRKANTQQISKGMVEIRGIADRAAVMLKLQSRGVAA